MWGRDLPKCGRDGHTLFCTLNSNSTMKTREEQIDFIRLNGVRIASCAWNGFTAKGRGMVCVLSDFNNELLGQIPSDFMPAVDAAKIISEWEGSREKQMVKIYEPEKEVVICFVRSEGQKTDVDSYKVITRPPPPAAAEQE